MDFLHALKDLMPMDDSYILLLSNIVIKSTVFSIFVLTLARLWKPLSASVRHFLWLVIVLALIAIPLLSLILPSWDILLPSSWTSWFRPEPTIPIETAFTGIEDTVSWTEYVFGVWFVIAAGMVLLVAASNIVWTFFCRRKFQQVYHPTIINRFQELSLRMKLARPILLLQNKKDNITPMSWGIITPALFLPGRAKNWPSELLDSVITHELAHIKRLDIIWTAIGKLVCCMYWFNPLVWYIVRNMELEAEKACDDWVISKGNDSCTYANQLVNILREMKEFRVLRPGTITMTCKSRVEKRLMAILNTTQNRRPIKPLWGTTMLVAAIVLILPLVSLRLSLTPVAMATGISIQESVMQIPYCDDPCPKTKTFSPNMQIYVTEE